MINKYTLSRAKNVKFITDNLKEYIENNLLLSRYEENDPEREIAYNNFKKAYDYILNHPEVENDYKCLLTLHDLLMSGLDGGIKSQLSEEQIQQLDKMINQPTKANLEVAIDVMLYILDKRLFTDGDVRSALVFANKFMVDNGCGFITVAPNQRDTFREKLKEYKDSNDYDIKDWIYKYCIKGPKTDS